jgi:hypothetical protein
VHSKRYVSEFKDERCWPRPSVQDKNQRPLNFW